MIVPFTGVDPKVPFSTVFFRSKTPLLDISKHNLVVQGGKNFIASKFIETESTKVQYVGMGLGATPAALSDIQLQSEVATRAITTALLS